MEIKILVIDDNDQDCKIIERVLKKNGFPRIIFASTGEEGVRMVKEENPDVTIIDTNLPGIDGFETCKQIRDINGIKTKIIIITGFIDAVDAGKAKHMGADDYSVKTLDFSYLIDAIKKLTSS